jgi:hypothetical protein
VGHTTSDLDHNGATVERFLYDPGLTTVGVETASALWNVIFATKYGSIGISMEFFALSFSCFENHLGSGITGA